MEEGAAAARRGRVTVTLDLLGRKVLVHEAGEAAPSAGFALGDDPTADPSTFKTTPAAKAASATAAVAAERAAAAAAAAAKDPAAAASERAAVARAVASIRELKISAAPGLGRPPPVFDATVARPAGKAGGGKGGQGKAQEKGGGGGGKQGAAAAAAAGAGGGAGGGSRGSAAGKAAAARRPGRTGVGEVAVAGAGARAVERVQDEDAFVEFGADLLLE
jgi:hypothetical protein